MAARARLETRQAGAGRSNSRKRETVILRDDEVAAALPESDPSARRRACRLRG